MASKLTMLAYLKPTGQKEKTFCLCLRLVLGQHTLQHFLNVFVLIFGKVGKYSLAQEEEMFGLRMSQPVSAASYCVNVVQE
jgi:hypothetical protein